VVTEGGALVVGKSKGGYQGHIDLAGGKPVLAAGEVTIVNGRLVELNNKSGHYQPSGLTARKAAEDAFSALGFDTTGVYNESY
jgi:filamentous hemagglutinin